MPFMTAICRPCQPPDFPRFRPIYSSRIERLRLAPRPPTSVASGRTQAAVIATEPTRFPIPSPSSVHHEDEPDACTCPAAGHRGDPATAGQHERACPAAERRDDRTIHHGGGGIGGDRIRAESGDREPLVRRPRRGAEHRALLRRSPAPGASATDWGAATVEGGEAEDRIPGSPVEGGCPLARRRPPRRAVERPGDHSGGNGWLAARWRSSRTSHA